VVGGAKSGKSSLAQRLAEKSGQNPFYVATAQAWDQEMEARIKRHQLDRGPAWSTLEEPVELKDALIDADHPGKVFLVDCLTLWLSNLITLKNLDNEEILKRFDELAQAITRLEAKVILVANEVGMGIVPENALARRYRDLAGGLNQLMGRTCEQAILVSAGIPLVLKGPALF
jgi:adenosylcobinamide kinase/adenosylcobinamide-phosphate guanylyltransferase